MNRKFNRRSVVSALSISLASALLVSCSVPRYDGSMEGKAATIDAVHLALTNGDCQSAVLAIEGLYNSAQSDNDVRKARAAAQACVAGMADFFGFVSTVTTNAAVFGSQQMWAFLAQQFYDPLSSTLDKKISGAENATDALMAMIDPGTVIAFANRMTTDPYNMGSTLVSDRVNEAVLYQIFLSLATMGNMLDRYGAPNPTTFARGQNLGATSANAEGWGVVTSVDDDACAFGSSIVNMVDGITQMAAFVDPSTQSVLNSITSTFSTAFGQACNAGCKGAILDGINYNTTTCAYADNLCLGTGSTPCPMSLRDRLSCRTDPRAQCAASGLAIFVSKDPGFGWP